MKRPMGEIPKKFVLHERPSPGLLEIRRSLRAKLIDVVRVNPDLAKWLRARRSEGHTHVTYDQMGAIIPTRKPHNPPYATFKIMGLLKESAKK